MLDIMYYAAIAIFVGFVAQVVFYFVKFLIKLRASEWDVDELERRLSVEESAVPLVAKPAYLIIDLEAEAHSGVIYCFDAYSRRFVCQGVSVDELNKNLSRAYSNKKVVGRIVRTTQEARELLIAAGARVFKEDS